MSGSDKDERSTFDLADAAVKDAKLDAIDIPDLSALQVQVTDLECELPLKADMHLLDALDARLARLESLIDEMKQQNG